MKFITGVHSDYFRFVGRASLPELTLKYIRQCIQVKNHMCVKCVVKHLQEEMHCGVIEGHILGKDHIGNCDLCGQTFTQFTPMAIHKRLHTGERPYACETCGKTFVSRSTMMSHAKKHV
ncbi:hypothetical protein NQ314_018070, partial [Rhamnusium bicolor]